MSYFVLCLTYLSTILSHKFSDHIRDYFALRFSVGCDDDNKTPGSFVKSLFCSKILTKIQANFEILFIEVHSTTIDRIA